MWTAQINIATSFVFATVSRPISALGAAPNGVLFVEFDPIQIDPSGKYYVNGQFQVAKP